MAVKNLSRIFEAIFDIDLSNAYRERQDMYSQKNPASSLDFLRDSYLEGMDVADERFDKKRIAT